MLSYIYSFRNTGAPDLLSMSIGLDFVYVFVSVSVPPPSLLYTPSKVITSETSLSTTPFLPPPHLPSAFFSTLGCTFESETWTGLHCTYVRVVHTLTIVLRSFCVTRIPKDPVSLPLVSGVGTEGSFGGGRGRKDRDYRYQTERITS